MIDHQVPVKQVSPGKAHSDGKVIQEANKTIIRKNSLKDKKRRKLDGIRAISMQDTVKHIISCTTEQFIPIFPKDILNVIAVKRTYVMHLKNKRFFVGN